MTKQNEHSGGRKGKPEHKVLVSGSIQVHRPPEIEKRHDTERKDDDTTHNTEREEDRRRERKKMWLEGLTLGAVVIYAGITYWQGCLTRESISNNTKQFQIDQRPYMWTSNTTPEMSVQKDQRMWMNISPVNFGRSPALNVRYIGKILIGPTAKADADKWFGLIGDKEFANPDMTVAPVPPGIPSVFPQPPKDDAAKLEPGKPHAAMQGGFGGAGYITVFSDKVLTQPEVDSVLNIDEYAFMVLRMRYYDAFGNLYWTDVCMYRFQNGSIPFCSHHNEMH